MTALAVALGARERGFHEDQVRPAVEVVQRVGGAGVGPVDDPSGALGGGDGHREGLREVGHRLESDPNGADLELACAVVLAQVERLFDQILVAPRADHPPKGGRRPRRDVQLGARRVVGSGPAVDGHGLLSRRVGERIGEGHEIEEVVGVQVRDHHGVHVHVVHPLPQLSEDPVAAVDQHGDPGLLDQVAGTGTAGVLPGRRLAQDRQPHGPGA